MEKCRICLNTRKRTLSLHDSLEDGISYADLLTSLANLNISRIDGIPDKICFACCKRMKDIHDFMCLIKRSEIELQKSYKLNKIASDIEDLKCETDITNTDKKEALLHLDNITDGFVQGCQKSLNYNDTTIRRTTSSHKNNKETLSVKEFLESIKEDPDNEYDIVYNTNVDFDPVESNVEDTEDDDSESKGNSCGSDKTDDEDEDYTPTSQPRKYVYYKKKDKSGNKIAWTVKPVFLPDIRVAKYEHLKTKTCHKPKVYKRRENVCPRCGKLVKHLKQHMLIHKDEKSFKCPDCPKSFITQTRLNTHQMTHGNPVYKCDKCVAAFKTPSGLKSHQLIHNGKKKQIPCEICGSIFRSKHHLWRHCQGIHKMGTKKYTCDQCDRSFVVKYQLNHHMRVHTGERPYKCEICSQPYSYRNDFLRHCEKKHEVSLKGRKVFVMNEEVLAHEQAVMRSDVKG